MAKTKDFSSEAELCLAYTQWATEHGFIVYAETAGWDLLLVAPDGAQLGVEAKLDLNLKVIAQALKGTHWRENEGPDFRAVLVPARREGVDDILAALGLGLILPQHRSYRSGEYKWNFDRRYHESEWFDWNPVKRCELPAYLPDVPAGVPSPMTLSPWKIGALRVTAILQLRGFITRDKVRDCGNDPRRWCAGDGWLSPLGKGRWGPGKAPRFDLQHPVVYAKILAETREDASVQAMV